MVDEAVVALDGLKVRYGRVEAVRELTLEVATGEVMAILGRNGSGKSSAIRALLGLVRPSAGTARLFGRDSWRERARLMARVGVVPEHLDMPPDMPMVELVRFFRRVSPRWDDAGVAGRLHRFGVPTDRPFGRLSKGQQRQGALALALGSSPELVILDDPTLGLDPVARDALYHEVIDDLADRGATVLLATHDLAGIEGIADRVAIVSEGQLLLDQPLEILKGRWRRVRGVVAEGFAPEPVEAAVVDLGVEITGRTGRVLDGRCRTFGDELAARLAAVAGLEGATTSAMSLDEIFRGMCGEGGA
jgi:ABC-2 type transport system ATP-binding protein